ncbi:MAG TPA: hypothetical protein VNM67_10520, partial [Thermoanaerobaculia bacterium]|nr:hypothetical protein [Thermoanaerobaculia bacterium]
MPVRAMDLDWLTEELAHQLTPAEAQQVLLEWNDCRTAYPREACIHDLVAEWAERTPEAIAVVCGEASLSYR